MPLTEIQRRSLIDRVNTLPINTVLTYFQSGEITFADVPQISAERKQYIEEQLNKMPNPLEQQEWAEIQSLSSSPSPELLKKIESYIRKWDGVRPAENHVDDARNLYNALEAQVRAQAEQIERQDWERVNVFSQTDLMAYLAKYPNTVHKSEIDDLIWGLVDKENVTAVQNYITNFPNGNHIYEANNVLHAVLSWTEVKNSEDVFKVNDYIRDNPETPFIQKANELLLRLKQMEMHKMKASPNTYQVKDLLQLLSSNVFSERELINNNIVTSNILEILRMRRDVALPDVSYAIELSRPECKEGYTDVFFFGVPSTGKTCVLMGMSRSNSLHINLASGGGKYAEALQQYTDFGKTVPPTPGDFVATLEATITSVTRPGAEHKINLVEMSGEEFVMGIADNPEGQFTFESMATGATNLLSNDNRKVFFLIIDPTASTVIINREVITYNEQTGEPTKTLRSFVVNQRTLIHKIVDILQDPNNAEIMKKVDSIHIIMTKADLLGNSVEREEKANNIFQATYAKDILTPLIKLSEEYNINAATNFHPKLYTSSLGTFYVGGLYEYEPNDSNRLVTAICNSTHSVKEKTWWDRLKEIVNK